MPMQHDMRPQSKLTPAQSPSLLWRILVALGLVASVPSAGIQLYERVYPAKSVSKTDIDNQDLQRRLQQTEQRLEAISTLLRQSERPQHMGETPNNSSASPTKIDGGNGEQTLTDRIDKAEADLRLLHESLKRLDSLEHRVADAVNQIAAVKPLIESLNRKNSELEIRLNCIDSPNKVVMDPDTQRNACKRLEQFDKIERQIGFLIQKLDALSATVEARSKAKANSTL